MAITLLMPDGLALTAQQERQAKAPQHGGGSGRPLGGRSGFRVGTPSNILTATSTTWTLGPCAIEIDPGAAVDQGMYGWANSANTGGSMNAADSTYARKDIVYIQINDPTSGDGTGTLSYAPQYLAGPADGTNAPPSLPPRSFLVGTITVPQAGGGSPTVVRNPAVYVAAGGLLPIVSNAERDTLTPYDGMAIARTDYDGIEIYDGTAWGGPLTATLVSPPDSGWSIDGGITRVNAQSFKQCTATLKLTRLGTPTATINQTFSALLTATIPAAWRPAMSVQGMVVMSTVGGVWRGDLECLIGTNGDIAFRVASGSLTLTQNDVFYVNISWWQ